MCTKISVLCYICGHIHPGTAHVGPTWKYLERFPIQNVQDSMSVDSHLQTHPIKVLVKNPADIGSLFDHAITYNKGIQSSPPLPKGETSKYQQALKYHTSILHILAHVIRNAIYFQRINKILFRIKS